MDRISGHIRVTRLLSMLHGHVGANLLSRLHYFCSGRNYRLDSIFARVAIIGAHLPTISPPSHINLLSLPSAPRSRRRKPRPCRHRHRRTFRWLYRSGQPSPHLPQPEKKMKFSTNKYTNVSSKPYTPTNDQTFFLHVTQVVRVFAATPLTHSPWISNLTSP